MLINAANLDALRVGFSTAFQAGLGQAPSTHARVCTRFPAATRKVKYGWLGELPGMRRWVGPRQIKGLTQYDYEIENKPFEETIGVDRDDVEYDNLGIYAPRFTAMGRAVGAAQGMLVWEALKNGFDQPCYDGQSFFDSDHPVLDKDGNEVSVANTDGGSGAPWFLIDSKAPILPIILQVNKEAEFVSKDDPRDDNVFMNKQFLYGADGRWAAGYAFWWWSWASKQTLNKANYRAAREALMAMKADHGRPIGVMPDLLIVPPALEGEGLEILNAERDAAGATNVYKGTAELLVVPWLA